MPKMIIAGTLSEAKANLERALAVAARFQGFVIDQHILNYMEEAAEKAEKKDEQGAVNALNEAVNALRGTLIIFFRRSPKHFEHKLSSLRAKFPEGMDGETETYICQAMKDLNAYATVKLGFTLEKAATIYWVAGLALEVGEKRGQARRREKAVEARKNAQIAGQAIFDNSTEEEIRAGHRNGKVARLKKIATGPSDVFRRF